MTKKYATVKGKCLLLLSLFKNYCEYSYLNLFKKERKLQTLPIFEALSAVKLH